MNCLKNLSHSALVRPHPSRTRFGLMLVCPFIFQFVIYLPPEACAAATSQPATSGDRATLTLDQIGDAPPEAAPTTRPAAPTPESVKRQLRIAEDRIAEKALAEASAALDRALEIEPENIAARPLAAQVAIQQGDMAAATRHVNAAIAIDPQNVAAHRILGDIELNKGSVQSAIAAYRAALASTDARPDDPQTLLTQLGVGLVLKREGYFRAAADALEVFQAACEQPTPAMKSNVELVEAFRLYRDRLSAMVGECRLKSGEFARAVPPLRAALKAAPENNSAKHDLMMALARSEQSDEALSMARAAATADGCTVASLDSLKEVCGWAGPKCELGDQLMKLVDSVAQADALMNVADAAQNSGDVKVAEAAIQKVLAEDPKHSDARVRLARLRLKSPAPQFLEALAGAMADAPEAHDQIDECLQMAVESGRGAELLDEARSKAGEKKDASLSYIVARLRLDMGQPDEAAAEFEALLGRDKENVAACTGLMAARMKQFRWGDAISVAESAIKEGLSSAQLHLLLGRSHAAMDEFEKAEAAFLESFAQSRKDSTPLRELAELLERRDESTRCEEIYRRIVNEVNPRDAVAREALVRLYLISDNPKAATKYFADFKELGQTGPVVESTAALLDFATARGGDGEARLEKYRSALRQISKTYPKHLASRFDLAMSYIRWAKYADAMVWVDDALQVDGEDLKSLELKAQLQTRLLDFEGSLATWKHLLKYRPRSAAWLGQLIEAHLTVADFDSAVSILRDLVERDDLSAYRERYVRLLLAALAAGGHKDEALSLARKRLEEDPKDISRRGRLLFELGQSDMHDEAIETARSYLEKDPNDDTLRTLLIGRLDEGKRYVEAQSQLLTWLEKTPEDQTLNHFLVVMHWREKNWDGAIEVCQAAAESPTLEEDFKKLQAQTLLLAGRYDQAIAQFETLTENKVGDPLEAAQVDLILALMQAERYAEAEKTVLRIVGPQFDGRQRGGRNPDLRMVLRFRGLLSNIYQAMGRLDEAYEQLVEIRRANPTDPEANNNLAYTWSEGGVRLERAEKYVRAALAEEPRNAAYLDTLGWILYKRGHFNDAIQWIKLAMKQHAEPDPVMMTHLADALARSGDASAAEPLWKSAQELVMQDKEENRSYERKALRKTLEIKLNALRDGKPVPTAPLPTDTNATSRPAATQPTEEE